MRIFSLILLLTFLTGIGFCQEGDTVFVSRIVDGDTFVIQSNIKVRFFGIDTPERDQPFGPEATQYLRKLIEGKEITIHCPTTTLNRPNCYVYLGNLDVSEEMVKAGLAYDWAKYSRGKYSQEEERARQNRVGVWSLPNAIPPWQWRAALKRK